MSRTFPLSIIRSFSLYTRQSNMSYRFADSLQAGSGRNVLILLVSSMTYTVAVGIKLYMFRTVHTGLLTARELSAKLFDIYHCCVYSEKLLMMDRGSVRNKERFNPKIKLRNKCI